LEQFQKRKKEKDTETTNNDEEKKKKSKLQGRLDVLEDRLTALEQVQAENKQLLTEILNLLQSSS